jgi:signal transduction histidine kinase
LLLPLAIVLYVVVFPYARTVVGDVVGALSSVLVLIAGNYYSRRMTWLVAVVLIGVNGVLFAVTDVTVQRNAEWQGAVLGAISLLVAAELMGRLRESALRLEKSGHTKDRFLAGVSHELRTPLTVVVGYASILKSTWPNLTGEERDELLDVLYHQSGEVANIVEDLLVATRLDTDELSFSTGRAPLVREVDAVTSALVVPSGTQLQVSIPDGVEVLVDAGRLRQILRNLLSNACRYGGPRVAVDAALSGDTVVVTVSDNGPGLPRDEWESIFDAYYRSHTREGQPDSVGLGLTVSRHLARRMDGDLTYSAADGESRFVLTLPAANNRDD